MPTPNEAHKIAEECYRLANEAKTETDRLACLDLARTWLEAASRQDDMTGEQIAEAQKSEPKPKPEAPQPKTSSGWRPRGGADLSRHRRRACSVPQIQGGRGGVWADVLQVSIRRDRSERQNITLRR
jgi:hypothetical protein